MEKINEMNCKDFTAALASKSPVPGGGGAAALAGALGCALGAMVANYTSGKKKYIDVEDDILRILKEISSLQNKLLDLIQEDADGFELLSKTFALSSDDPEKDTTLEFATRNATNAPFEMIKCCCQAVELLKELSQKGNSMLLSDAACGTLLCSAAIRCAAINVYVNTAALKDRETAANIDAEVDTLLEIYIPMAEETAAYVENIIRVN